MQRLITLLLLLSLSPVCQAVSLRAVAPAGGRGLYAAAPESFSRSFAPLTQWLGTPAGMAAIKADPPLRHFLLIDLKKESGQAVLSPLVEGVPSALLAELEAIQTLDESRRAAALGALAEARSQASPEVELRVSDVLLAVQTDPEALSLADMRDLEIAVGRLALFSPAGRKVEKSIRRLRTERLMRQAGQSAERLRFDQNEGAPAPAAWTIVGGGPTNTRGKIVLSLSPALPPSSYYDARHWRTELVPDAAYGSRLSAAAALFGQNDRTQSPSEVSASRARLALTETVRELDPKIYSHMMRVGLFAGLIAYQMGHSVEYAQRVAWGARIHDIGKREDDIRNVVNKEGRLEAAERAIMERHPKVGADIIAHAASLDVLSRRVGMKVALNHHETLDGLGYPRGLKGDEIPLESRITSIADFYDALMENRPYRAGMSSAEAVAIMSKSAHKFDPTAWKAFLSLVAPSAVEEKTPAVSAASVKTR